MSPPCRTLTEAVFGVPDPPMSPDEEADLAERIDLVLHTLGPREAYVIRQRFLRKPPRTTDQVAAVLRVAPSRTSQIEAQAPVTVDRLPLEVARAVLNRLLAVQPELRDLAQRLSESVIAVLEDEPKPSPSTVSAPPTPDPTNGG